MPRRSNRKGNIMMSMKKTLTAATLAAIALGALATSADAGQRKFRKHFGFHYKPWGYHYIHKPYYYGGCFHFKRKYYRTGRYHWLKKYERCRYGW